LRLFDLLDLGVQSQARARMEGKPPGGLRISSSREQLPLAEKAKSAPIQFHGIIERQLADLFSRVGLWVGRNPKRSIGWSLLVACCCACLIPAMLTFEADPIALYIPQRSALANQRRCVPGFRARAGDARAGISRLRRDAQQAHVLCYVRFRGDAGSGFSRGLRGTRRVGSEGTRRAGSEGTRDPSSAGLRGDAQPGSEGDGRASVVRRRAGSSWRLSV
jgi:hypothetical protein